MKQFGRRDFIRLASLSALPLALPVLPAFAAKEQTDPTKDSDMIYFINDGIFYRPADFLGKLQEIASKQPIIRDFYSEDGTMKELLDKCCEITGKEDAVYMPSGTLANQLALKVLSGDNPKLLVQETSHVYRDEADAAQSIFGKRLIPLGKGNAGYSLEELQQTIAWHKNEEAFEAGIGALSLETPVRRCTNTFVPLKEIEQITAYCRANNIRTHLDGARLHMATAFTGNKVIDYAKHFDTVYMCLYKYLGATGGAVLCGDKAVIGKMKHLIKVHGGSIFTNWPSAAMALHHLQDIDTVLQDVIRKSTSLYADLNKIKGVKVTALDNGTNISHLTFDKTIDTVKLSKWLRAERGIIVGQPQPYGAARMFANATLLRRENAAILSAFREGISYAKS